MSEAPEIVDESVAKSAFAQIIGVSPGRVSQMIAEGKISGFALDGEGRSAKIRVETARAQLRQHTDLGQRFGNGINTRLHGDVSAVPAALAVGEPELAPRLAEAEDVPLRFAPPARASQAAADPVADRLKELKLEQAERANQRETEEERARRGVYIRADQSRAALIGVAQTMLNVFEGGISDLAQALATAFEVPQRDVTHILRREFRELRAKAAQAAKQRASALRDLIEDAAGDDLVEEGEAGEG